MFFGPKARALRKEKGLSMADIAKELGVSESFVSLLETGKRECQDGKMLFLLAQKLDCEMEDLTDSEDVLQIAHAMHGNPLKKPKPPIAAVDCPNCKSKDAEIVFLRDALKSALDRIPKAQ